ncbi:LysR family transcriptional regulator [Streptomyces sp. NBC_01186]|uniref:LysR family transcriptional regulator n=1 Tax=unclassified Streptomyces TaxID=2593676 RepID=UPI002DDBB89B|nr:MULTISPECIES: LysR family transcriptional regulator [unclassified Streptomyces]WSB76148.1 LysR family transcriptional regulator [Streptomyces sp. NBC_01775]WSS15578.1 LysR family transcriptional regulator [Streptomyces sp. NBC_01186]
MSLRQMEYLVTVIEESSFTRAAEALHVTQSALSHQIKALEREVGGPLLERLPRGVRLTPMGRAFLPDAELAVRSARQARRAARAAAGVDGGELEIATVHGLAVGVLTEAVARMRRRYPEVTLRLREYATEEELREHMARGIADLAVGYRPARWPGPSWQVGEEEIALVVPADDPLCGRPADEPVELTELADRGWVRCGMEPWVDGRQFLDHVCAQAGFVPRTAVRVEHPTTAARLAAAGAGICLMSAFLAPAIVPSAQLVPIGPPWRRPLTAYARSEPTGAAEAFIRLLTDP